MSRVLWRALADVASMADTLGATTHLAERCRVLASRAEYYLGESGNKRGLVRGELAREEWMAFHELVREFADVSPPLKAFAQAIGEFDTDQPITVMDELEEQDKQPEE